MILQGLIPPAHGFTSIDVLLKDLGVSPYRKMPNVFAEVFARYEAADYKGVTEEYYARRKKRGGVLKVKDVDT